MAQITIQDGQEAPSTVQIPIEDPTPPSQVHQQGVTRVLTATGNDRDPAEAYVGALQANDRGDTLAEWTRTTTEDRLDVINSQLGYLQPEQVQSELVSLQQNLSGDTTIQGNYIETVKSMPQSIGKPNDLIAAQAVQMQMRELLSEFTPQFKDMEPGDIASSIGGLLIPKRSGAGYAEFMTDMGFIDGILEQREVFIDPTDAIVKMRNMFWDLNDEGQKQFLNLMAEHLPNSSDNPFIRGEIVNSIIGGSFNDDASVVFQQLDNIDLIGFSGAILKLGRSIVRSGSILNFFKRADPDLAAETVSKATKNPEGASKVGVTQAAIGDAINPLLHGPVGTFTTGAPDDAAASIKKMIDLQDARFESVTEEISRRGLQDQDALDDVMRAAEIEALKVPGIVDVVVNQFDETGFTLTSTEAYFDELGAVATRNDTKTIDFQVNDIGELRAPVEEWVDNGILTLDPNARMEGTLRKVFVSDVESLARQQEMTANAFKEMMVDAFKGLDKSLTKTGFNAKKAAINVDHALQYGAKRGKTYTFEELTNGITGRDMTAGEAQAYIGVRNVVEKLYRLKNKQIVDNLLADGVKLYDGAEGVLPVRNYDTWQAGNTAWQQVGADSHHVLVPDGGLTLKGVEMKGNLLPFERKSGLTQEMIKDAYSKGYILTRNHSQQGLFRSGEVKTQWAFVKASKLVSPRGQQVIHRIEGYMPKQRTGAYYFIKKQRNIGLSGAPEHTSQVTVAYGDTKQGADAWVALQKNPEDFSVVFDREMTNVERMYATSSTHGGMYSGARKSEELLFVGDGKENFADSFEAMQHYINHIGRQYPASLYRLGAEERLMQFGRDLGLTGRDLTLQTIMGKASNKFAATSPEFKMLKGIHDQLSFVNMIPTEAEQNMANQWKVIGNMFDTPRMKFLLGTKVPRYFYQKAAKNMQPQDIIRGVTFNHLLGMYNPAQLIVQYSGALVGGSIDPINAGRHVRQQWGWTVMDARATDPIEQKKMLKWFKDNGLEEYTFDYQLWAKSGFRESVVQGNADYTSVLTKNLPYDAGMLQKIMANHTVFYKMGELANTRFAFATAISRYKKVHNVKHIDPNDSAALEEVGLWAEKFRLNMSRANQSSLNKGWKAVPFQFQQIISKYFEKVLPQMVGGTDELTSWEKARLGIIPTVATGVVALPLGDFILQKIFEMSGINKDELDEDTIRLAKHGVIGWMNSEVFNLNINFSERMTLGGDVMVNIWDSFTTGSMPWQYLGPTGNVADKYWRNGQYLTESFSLLLGSEEDIDMETIEAMPSIIWEVASDIPSVTSNFKKYMSHIMSDNPAFIVDGKYKWDWETMNRRTALMASAGFQANESTDIYDLNKEIADSDTAFSVFGETDADIILRIINTRLLTGKQIKDTALYARIVNSMLRKYGPIEQMKLLTLMRDKTFKRQFDQNNLLYKYLVESKARQQEGLDGLNVLINRKLKERQ